MSWSENSIWWHTYQLGFCGAPIRPDRPQTQISHRLPRLTDWLDYLIQLGANGLLLGPIFSSSSHGYDTTDHFTIDRRLGDLGDFTKLIDLAHRRGIKVMLDGVFNHVGRQHPWVQRALNEGPDGQYAHFFTIDWSDPADPKPLCFEGSFDLVVLNHQSPAVVDYVVDVMNTWCDRGADAWRLDAAYAVDPGFWAQVLPRVRQRHPEVYVLAEMIHGDYSAYLERAGMDSITQYELWKATWSALDTQNFFELDWTLQRHNDLLTHFLPFTFVGNHDVTRIASKIGPDKAILALVVLLTVGGSPAIYAGDEQGFTGVKYDRSGGDDEVRAPFPDSPDQLAGFGASTHALHQQLIALRRQRPWLTRALTEQLALTNERYTYRSIAADDSAQFTVTLDVQGAPTAEIREGDNLIFSFSG